MKQLHTRTIWTLWLAFLAFGALDSYTAQGQAMAVATKPSDIGVFAGGGHFNPDYGMSGDNGLVAGFLYTRYLRFPIAPSIEVRGNYVAPLQVTEKSIAAGLRLSGQFHRLHPYGDFLVGGGEIAFHPAPNPGYTGDRGRIYSYGGGVDVDLIKHFALMVDYQEQAWNLGANLSVKPTGDFTLSPTLLTVGLHYTIPFKARNHQ